MRPPYDPFERINRLAAMIQRFQAPLGPRPIPERFLEGFLRSSEVAARRFQTYEIPNPLPKGLTLGAGQTLSNLTAIRHGSRVFTSQAVKMGEGVGARLPMYEKFKAPLGNTTFGVASDTAARIERLIGSSLYTNLNRSSGLSAIGPMTAAFPKADSLSESYLERIAARLSEAIVAEPEELESQVVEPIISEINRQFSRLETSAQTLQARGDLLNAVMLILTLVALVTQVRADADEAVFQQQLLRLETQHNQWLERLATKENAEHQTQDSLHWFAVKEAPLRASPTPNAAKVGRVYPNQVLEQLDRQGNYVLVSYFDYTAGFVKTGWLHHSHLQRVR